MTAGPDKQILTDQHCVESAAILANGRIRLTVVAESALHPRTEETVDQTGKRDQILDPERASPRRQRDERVHVRRVCPRPRQRALHAVLIEEKHAVLAPRPPGDHEHELATPPRMERMRHTNSSLPNSATRRSRKRTRKGRWSARIGSCAQTSSRAGCSRTTSIFRTASTRGLTKRTVVCAPDNPRGPGRTAGRGETADAGGPGPDAGRRPSASAAGAGAAAGPDRSQRLFDRPTIRRVGGSRFVSPRAM